MTPLLFDNNLPRALCHRIADVIEGCRHVADFGMARANDSEIWNLAAREGLVIVSKDSDFRVLASHLGSPPKVVLVVVGNAPTSHVEAVLRRNVARLEEFCNGTDALLILHEPFRLTT